MQRHSAVAVIAAAACTFAILTAVAAPALQVNFRDIAAQSGLTIPNISGGLTQKQYILETTGNGVAIFDYDGDGRNDIFIANGTRLDADPKSAPLAQLYHNDGNGHFTNVAAKAGLTATGWGQGVCVADFDNDGHPDLLVTYYGHNVLYRNRGNGTFEDATAKAHLPTTGIRYGGGCSFTDYDRDGNLDLFVANYVNFDLATTPKPGENEFCEWKSVPVMCGPRGLPKSTNLLYHNLHNGTFEERGAEAGVAFNFDGALQSGMGIAVGDYDGDGFLDIAKTNFSGDLSSLYHNDDGKFFTDLSREAGVRAHSSVGWGIQFLDVDDDGWPDLVIVNGHVYPELEKKDFGDRYLEPPILYRNLGNGKFSDITTDAGPAFQVSRSSRGLAVGDLDGDGRPEMVIVNMNAAPALLKNFGPHGHYLNVALTGTKSNRSAIGARVVVTAAGRKWIDEVMSGASYYSQNSFTLHYGMGSVAAVDGLQVRWPSGTVQNIGKTNADQTLHITEPK